MATIDDKTFIDSIIKGNGWHMSCQDGKDAPDNPRVFMIVEYTNAYGNITWGITFTNEHSKNRVRYLVESEYVRNPKTIWHSENFPL